MKLLVAGAFVAAAAGAYLYTNSELVARWLRLTPFEREPVATRLYKWKDDEGQWHVTDKPPPAGTDHETLDYRGDVNILPLPPQLEGGG